MSLTNFSSLTAAQITVWSRDVWSAARDAMFLKKFMGSDERSMIHVITELTETSKGKSAIVQLVADLIGDGVVGDNEREGNEEALSNYADEINIDVISHGNINKGKLASQKTAIDFRSTSKNKLGYWLGNRIDQLCFLALSGISFAYKNNGAARTNSQFPYLAFAGDVTAPSTNRHVRWTGTALTSGNTAAITTSDVPNYKMLVQLKSYAADHYIKPLISGGKEYYVVLLRPGTLAQLKQDSTYISAISNALPRSENNPFFTGGVVTVDGLVLHEHRLVYNTTGAASGSRWGSDGTIHGTRTLLCGQQALAFCKLGNPSWVEKGFDYENRQGINVDQMLGILKPRFPSIYESSTTTLEDFGVVACDHYLPFV